MRVTASGRGPAVALVHGVGIGPAAFEAVADLLAPHCTVPWSPARATPPATRTPR